MTVVADIVVESRRYSGWIDRRYPIGYWVAALQVIGDATGGTLEIRLLFQTANGPARLNSQMYSVERLSITAAENAARVARVVAVNMAGPSNVAFAPQYSLQMDVQSGTLQSAVRGDQFSFLPWFLGSQRDPGITTSLSMILLNRDAISFRFEAEGYRWSARSVLVDGGPQRPPTGLYRA